MSYASVPFKIYNHGDYVQKILVLHDQERFVSVGLGCAKVFSLRSNVCLMDFEEPSGDDIRDALLFDDDTLVAFLGSTELCFWSLSNGKFIQCISVKELEDIFGYPKISLLGDGRLMVSGVQRRRMNSRSKAVLLEAVTDASWAGSEESIDISLNVLSVCTSFGGVFSEISVHENRFVTGGPHATAQVWIADSEKFRRLRILRPEFIVGAVLIDEKHIIVGTDGGYGISVYSAKSLDLMHEISTTGSDSRLISINSACLIFEHQRSLKTVRVFDVKSGNELWNLNIKAGVRGISVSIGNEPQLIIATSREHIITLALPEHIAGEIKNSNKLMHLEAPLPPLQAALISCLSGHSSPTDHCSSTITYSTCAASFTEWCCAHHILLLAVKNGDIKNSTIHEGSISHWFDNLYIALKDVDITSEEDYGVAKRYLEEAKRMGVVEGVEGVLSALHVTKAQNEELRGLQRAGIFIFEKVMCLENRLDALRECFQRYRKYQMYSQCIGIALQVIPIVGGATAGAVSAGANIVEGLSIKDVADYAFGLGANILDGEISTFGDRVFSRASDALCPESTAKMEEEDYRRLENALAKCGFDIQRPRDLFIEHFSADRKILEKKEIDMEHVDEKRLQSLRSERANNENPVCTIFPARKSLCVPFASFHHPSYREEEDQSREEKDGVQGIPVTFPSKLKSIQLSRSLIKELDQIEISALWTAYVFRYDDKKMDRFLSLRDRICCVMEDCDLDGEIVVYQEQSHLTEVVRTVVEGLRSDGKGDISFGVQTRLKFFLDAIV